MSGILLENKGKVGFVKKLLKTKIAIGIMICLGIIVYTNLGYLYKYGLNYAHYYPDSIVAKIILMDQGKCVEKGQWDTCTTYFSMLKFLLDNFLWECII